jgi:pimeloyl-ACP methyl ester carboxylesterase
MLFSTFRGWMDSLHLTLAPVMIGHGLGAYLCMRYALGHPYKVNKLVLINPLLMPEQLSPLVRQLIHHSRMRQLVMRFAPDWTTRRLLGLPVEKNERLDERVLAGYHQASPFNTGIHCSISDLAPEIPDLPTQSLYIWGEADPLFEMSLLHALIDDIPEVLAYELAGVGHRPHLENPEQTSKLITDFLLGL